jgi:hypothetical protein
VPHPRTVGEGSRAAQPLYENPLANACRTADRICTISITTVPKKSKSQTATAAAADEAMNTPAAASEPAKPIAKKRTAKAKAASAKPAAKKKPARKTSKPTPAVSNGEQSTELGEPSEADIRLRAYFIAERRVQLALQGNPALDWIEARQQLLQEARQARS